MVLTAPQAPALQIDAVSKNASSAKTVLEWMADPSLSTNARVLLALLDPYIRMHGDVRVKRENFAAALGKSQQHTSRAIAELEKRQIIQTQRGGRGIAKSFTFGSAVRLLGPENNSFIAQTQTERIEVSGYRNAKGDNKYLSLFDPPAPPETINPAITQPKTEQIASPPSHSPPHAIAKALISDNDKPGERESEGERAAAASSSSLLQKMRHQAGVTQKTGQQLLRDFPAERIERWLFALPYAIDAKRNTNKPVRDPAAFFIAAIVGNYEIPMMARRQLEHAALTIAKPTPAQTHEARLKALEFYHALSAPTRSEIEHKARLKIKRAGVKVDHAEIFLLAEINRYARLIGVQL